jgi:hypothetical protein
MSYKAMLEGETPCNEDLFWPGLRFAVASEEEFAREQKAAGDRVHFHDGVWWRELRHGFCQPCFAFREVDHRAVRPQFLRSPAGFMHVAAPGSPSNGVYRVIGRDRVQEYSLQQLGKKKRNVRSGLTRVQVRPVTSLEDLTGDGYEVYLSWRKRTAWGADKSLRPVYEAWIASAFWRPQRMVLGAYCQGKLVAFMLPYAVHNVAFVSFVASHSDALSAYPNDALYHAFLCIARQTPGIVTASMGPVCSKASLDRFKLCYGEIKEIPCYGWINPAIRLLAGRRISQRYPWLVITGAPALVQQAEM